MTLAPFCLVIPDSLCLNAYFQFISRIQYKESIVSLIFKKLCSSSPSPDFWGSLALLG